MLNVQNLDKLIAHLEAQPADKFDMSEVFTINGSGWNLDLTDRMHECGTAACIVGWIYTIAKLPIRRSAALNWLGISDDDGVALFTPDEFTETHRYPLLRAIATLKRLRDRFLATGEIVVDWGPEPGIEPVGEPWSAPKATEIKEPELPEALTRLLGAKVEA